MQSEKDVLTRLRSPDGSAQEELAAHLGLPLFVAVWFLACMR